MYITTKDSTFYLYEDESLLEGLERNGYYIDFQCRNGYCGACKTKISKGSVSYSKPPIALLNKDEILPCCCIVKENISINVLREENKSNFQMDLFFPDIFDVEL